MPLTRNAYQRRDVERVRSAVAARAAAPAKPLPSTDTCPECKGLKRRDREFCCADCASGSQSRLLVALREPLPLQAISARMGVPPHLMAERLGGLKDRGRVRSFRVSDATGSRINWQAC